LQLRRDIASGQLKLNGPNQATVTLLLEDGRNIRYRALYSSPTSRSTRDRFGNFARDLSNPRFVLLPGMFVRARIEEGVQEDAFLVPQVGVTHDPSGKATALVVGPDDKVTAHTLQLRGTSGDQWIVERGLDDGDRVIVGRHAEGETWNGGEGGGGADGNRRCSIVRTVHGISHRGHRSPKASPVAVLSKAK